MKEQCYIFLLLISMATISIVAGDSEKVPISRSKAALNATRVAAQRVGREARYFSSEFGILVRTLAQRLANRFRDPWNIVLKSGPTILADTYPTVRLSFVFKGETDNPNWYEELMAKLQTIGPQFDHGIDGLRHIIHEAFKSGVKIRIDIEFVGKKLVSLSSELKNKITNEADSDSLEHHKQHQTETIVIARCRLYKNSTTQWQTAVERFITLVQLINSGSLDTMQLLDACCDTVSIITETDEADMEFTVLQQESEIS